MSLSHRRSKRWAELMKVSKEKSENNIFPHFLGWPSKSFGKICEEKSEIDGCRHDVKSFSSIWFWKCHLSFRLDDLLSRKIPITSRSALCVWAEKWQIDARNPIPLMPHSLPATDNSTFKNQTAHNGGNLLLKGKNEYKPRI